ncbi:MAG: amidohydrolase [Synergistaceae bacterium]|nr:amidohydrolase [Synergistaceae bacterium]
MYSEKFLSQVISWRRDIHSHPELSQHEQRTSELAASVLESLGLEVKRNIGGFGVTGLLRGKNDSKTIGLRADMDALPLNEETGLEYASQTQGVMHACGHDTHTAMLLGAVCALSEIRDNLNGNVKFIFQPAEELNPVGGAPGMIRDGVLENPKVDALLALHVWPLYETGKIIMKSGPQMGASDRLFIKIHGKTAHGSAPDQGIDAIMIAAQVINSLQSIVSRSVSPLDSAVVTIGTIKGGYRYNVIPDLVELEGTVRTLREETQSRMPELITRTAKGVAESLGGSCEVKYVKGYPPLVNDSGLVKLASDSVIKLFGHDSLIIPEHPELGAEDFAFFARERPALMAWLGCRPANIDVKDFAMLHNTKFAPDENCFAYGINYFVQTVIDYLNIL